MLQKIIKFNVILIYSKLSVLSLIVVWFNWILAVES